MSGIHAEDLFVLDQIEEQRRRGARPVLGSLTELVEAIERICDGPDRETLPAVWSEGLEVLRAKGRQCLADHGVTVIPAGVGEKVDPRLHLVVDLVAGPGERETIVRQTRPGYAWRGQVLRPAEVVTVG